MNWIAIGAITDIIGTVAILVSLVYVAVQISQNTEQITRSIAATELAAFERNIDAGNNIRELIILHPEVAELFLKGSKSFSELNPIEKFRFSSLLRNMFSSAQGGYIRQLEARHDLDNAQSMKSIVDSLLASPGAQEWLAKSTPDWHPKFQKFVDERLAIIKLKA